MVDGENWRRWDQRRHGESVWCRKNRQLLQASVSKQICTSFFFFVSLFFFTNLQMFQRPKPQVFMSVWCLCHFRSAFQSLPLCSTPTLTLTLKVPVVVWHFEGLVTVRLYVLQFVCSKTRDCSSPSSLSWTDSKCVNEGSVGRCWETLWQPW